MFLGFTGNQDASENVVVVLAQISISSESLRKAVEKNNQLLALVNRLIGASYDEASDIFETLE